MPQMPSKAVTVIGALAFIPMRKSIKTKIKEPKFTLKDSYTFQGLPISIENKAGSYRRSMPGEKPVWSTKMGYDYGYIRNTEAKDKEAVDVYVNRKSKGKMVPYHDVSGGELVDTPVIVIHQKKIWKTSKWHNGICPDCHKHHTECKHAYDEDKVMLGFYSKEDAIKGYLEQYDSPRFLGPVSTYTLPEFKATLKRSFGKKLPYKNGNHEHWTGVDLDGTSAIDDGWKGKEHIGEPIEKMWDKIEKLLKEGKKVKIFTARAYDKKAIKPIQDWMKLNNKPMLEITNKKDPGMVEIWDDRARRIGKNTGNLIKSFYVDLDKSYLGQSGDSFGSTAMLRENIRKKNPKAIVIKKGCMKKMMTGHQETMDYKSSGHVMFTEEMLIDKVEEMYQENKLPNETKHEYIERSKKETIAKQSQMITGYMQKGVIVSDLNKAYVKSHFRHGKGGKISRVVAHTDKRTKKLLPTSQKPEKFREWIDKDSEPFVVFHNSPEKDSIKVTNEGMFGGIFAGGGGGGMGGKYEHAIVLDKNKIAKSKDLIEGDSIKMLEDKIYRLDDYSDEQIDIIDDLILEREEIDDVIDQQIFTNDELEDIFGTSDINDLRWEIQRARGDIADRMGFQAVVMHDEEGTSYLIFEGVKTEPLKDGETPIDVVDRINEEWSEFSKNNKPLEKSIIISREEMKKGFVKAHYRKGKRVNAFFTKRKKTVEEVKHKIMHRLDMSEPEAKAKIKLIEKAKMFHEDHVRLAKQHKEEAVKAKSEGKEHYEKHDRKYLVDSSISHLNDHIKHHENKIETHNNHIKKIEGRHETDAAYFEKKREKAKKTAPKKDGLTFGSQEEYMGWYRKQSKHDQENHKLYRVGGKLVVTMTGEEDTVKKEKPESKITQDEYEKKERSKRRKFLESMGKTEEEAKDIEETEQKVKDYRKKVAEEKIQNKKYREQQKKWKAELNAEKAERKKKREEKKTDKAEKKPLPEKSVVVKKEDDIRRMVTSEEEKRITDIKNMGPNSRIQMGMLDGKQVIKNKNLDGEWHLQPKISDIVAAKKTEAETSKSRSEEMMDNKNAEKPGGLSKEEFIKKAKTVELDGSHVIKVGNKYVNFSSTSGHYLGQRNNAEKMSEEHANREGTLGTIYDSMAIRLDKIAGKSRSEALKGNKNAYKGLSETEIALKYPFGSKQKEIDLDTKAAAKRIRIDIKEAIKKGDLPKGTTVSVKMDRYSGGSSIDLSVTSLPDDIMIMNPYRVKFEKEKPHASAGSLPDDHKALFIHSDEGRSIKKTLEAIKDQYNFGKGQKNKNFYGGAGFDYNLENADRSRIEAQVDKGKYSDIDEPKKVKEKKVKPPETKMIDGREYYKEKGTGMLVTNTPSGSMTPSGFLNHTWKLGYVMAISGQPYLAPKAIISGEKWLADLEGRTVKDEGQIKVVGEAIDELKGMLTKEKPELKLVPKKAVIVPKKEMDYSKIKVGREDYQDRKEARIDRLENKADKAEQESSSRHQAASDIAARFPFGQPILVGHHSEKKARRDQSKMHSNMDRAVQASKEADEYRDKAKAAESNRAISSDDPEAVVKLKEKLDGLQARQESMKKVNAAWRKFKKNPDSLDKSDLTDNQKNTIKLFQPEHSWDKGPYASFTITNNGANIRNTKQRLEGMVASSGAETKTLYDKNDIQIIDNVESNRIQVEFSGKPDEKTRKILKSNGFRWAPSEGVWQRKRSANANFTVRRYLIKELESMNKSVKRQMFVV